MSTSTAAERVKRPGPIGSGVLLGAVIAAFAIGAITAVAMGWVSGAGRGCNVRAEPANLDGCDLRQNDLRPATLVGAGMRGAKLDGMNLTGMDLRGAQLQGASLNGADLSSANLVGANLEDATLRGALLVKTCLRGAQLGRTDLTDADLTDADLRGAVTGNAVGLPQEVPAARSEVSGKASPTPTAGVAASCR